MPVYLAFYKTVLRVFEKMCTFFHIFRVAKLTGTTLTFPLNAFRTQL